MTNKPPYAPSTASFPSNVYDECHELNRKAAHLDRIAAAFAITGNDTVADDLFGIAQTIETANRAIREHIAARVGSDLKIAQDMSGAILGSALAGLRIAAAKDRSITVTP